MPSITGWVTVNGKHIPLIDGESAAKATKRYIDNKNNKTTSSKKASQNKVKQSKASNTSTKKASFTDSEKRAIDDWVRSDNHISEANSKILSSTIQSKGNVKGNVTLYRNVTSPELGVRFSEVRNNPDILVGKEITSRSFLSTSKLESGAQIFSGTTIKITNVKNTQGLDISKISSKSREQEVVFNKGTVYKITKCKLIKDKDGDVMSYDITASIIK